MAGKKQILLINYTGRHGGGPLIAYEMAKALIGKGMPVAAVIAEGIDNLEMWKRLPLEKLIVIPTYSSAGSFIRNHFLFVLYKKYQIKKKLRGYDIKAIYCPMCTFWTYPINKLFPQAKKVVACHDPILHSGEKYILANKIFRVDRAYKNADEIIVHTRSFIEFAERRYRKFGHVHYIPLGRHNFYSQIDKKRSIISYPADKTNFVFFGRISPYKGLHTLADAYKIVSGQCNDVTLTIIGAGDFEPYRNKYKELKQVTVINRWIADNEVESVFSGENLIAVLPYTDATQSGVAFVAMDCGVPVIATNTGGFGEQIEDGITGMLVEPDNPQQLAERMIALKNDKECCKRFCANMKKMLEHVKWEDAADDLLHFIEMGH